MKYKMFFVCFIFTLSLNAQILRVSTIHQLFNDAGAPIYSTEVEMLKAKAERHFNISKKIYGMQIFNKDGELLFESKFDKDGYLTEISKFEKIEGKKHEEKFNYQYNNEGNLSSMIVYTDGALTYKRDYRILAKPDGIAKIEFTSWSYAPGPYKGKALVEKYSFEDSFDSNHQIKKQKQTIDLKYNKNVIERTDEYYYDTNGNIVKLLRFIKKDTVDIFKFKYDDKNNKIEEEFRNVYAPPRSLHTEYQHRIYKYDNRNLPTQVVSYASDGSIIDELRIVCLRNLPDIDLITETIEDYITEWQKKGKYETIQDYETRMTKENMSKQTPIYTQQAINKLGQEKYPLNLTQLDYDADNQTYKILFANLHPIFINVPLAEAEIFDKNKDALRFEANYTFTRDSISLLNCKITNPANNKTYDYNSKQDVAFNAVKLDLKFNAIDVELLNHSNAKGQQEKEQPKGLVQGKSDVDINIPENKQVNDKTFVVIIANENYQKEVPVRYASIDGQTFKEYCEKTLGIPSKNIHLAIDATFGNMKSELKWICDVTKAYNGEAKIVFYYAGHGMPNEKTKSAYLIPVDGFSSDFETAIQLNDIYDKLTENPAKNVVVFLDACFSGSQRSEGMLAEARGVKIAPKVSTLQGQSLVFSAATGDETAYPYKEKQHGLFTYFLLKKLQETKGNVTLGELFDYLKTNVTQMSIVVNQKSQTPQVNSSPTISNWNVLKLK